MSVIRAVSDLLRIHVLPHLGGDRRSARVAFLESYRFPEQARAAFAAEHPELGPMAHDKVFDALKSFFWIHAVAPGSDAGMPSRIVEEAWAAFSRCGDEYARFCERVSGRFIEPPAGSAPPDDAIARTWAFSCARERVDARRPSRLPALFGIDRDLKVPNGRYYALNDADSEMALRVLGVSAAIVLASGLGPAAFAPHEWDEMLSEQRHLADMTGVPFGGGYEMAGGDFGELGAVGGDVGGGGMGGDG